MRLWKLAAVWGAAMGMTRVASAEIVVVDVAYTHSAQTTTDSHYRVMPLSNTPGNWTSPIDYASGDAWVRLEVKTKPAGETPTRYQICFELAVNYACTDQAPTYTKPGVYTWGTSFSKFYLGGPVDWSKGIRDTALILKDTNNVKPAPENVGADVSARYMPTDLHVTVTLVPKGETYVPPAISDAGSGGGPNDAAEPATDEASTSADGTTPPIDHPPIADTGTGLPTDAPTDPAPAAGRDAGLSTSELGPTPAPDVDSGCACSLVQPRTANQAGWLLAIPLLAALRRRRPDVSPSGLH